MGPFGHGIKCRGRGVELITVSRDALERALCKESFYDFFLRFWETLCPEPLVCNWHIEYLCNELQFVAQRVFKREPKEYDLIINVPPGSTKSSLVSEMYPAWCWANDPTLRFICGSHSSKLTNDLAKRCRLIVADEKYKRLFPEVELASEGIEILETTKGGQRISATPTGGVVGLHAHIQICDDLINPAEAYSEAIAKSTMDWQDQTLPSRAISRTITPLIMVMQRLARSDPTGHLLAKREQGMKIRHICLPAELTDRVRPRKLRSKYVNGLFDPIRLSPTALAAAKLQGEVAYGGQYLQDPAPPGGQMFRTSELDVVDTPGRIIRQVRYWDKAGTKDRGCFTVGTLMGIDANNYFWILNVVRGQWDANIREKIIKQTAIIDGKKTTIGIEEEGGSGGKESAQATVRNLMGFTCIRDKPGRSKEERADPFAAQVNGGWVKMIRAPWNGPLITELQLFPTGRFKDQVDACSGAFAMLQRRRLVGGLNAYGKR